MATPETIKELDDQRQTLISDLGSISVELKAMEGDRLDRDLVDQEGFPRADLDFGKLQKFKLLRLELSKKTTDLRELDEQIAILLFQLHAEKSEIATKEIAEYEASIQERSNQKRETEMMGEKQVDKPASTMAPFCRVAEVTVDSPAQLDGIMPGDLIISYGDVNFMNHNSLQLIAEVTKKNIDKPMSVKLLRSGQEIEVKVTPRQWSGKGVLGCRFLEKM